MNKRAFSLVELIFVIVIIAILSSFIVPKFSTTSNDAIVAKIKSQISTIRSAISLSYGSTVATGNAYYPLSLDNVENANLNSKQQLFINILDYAITSIPLNSSVSGKWSKVSKATDTSSHTIEIYRVWVGQNSIDFIYTQNNGKFDCDHSVELCETLTQ